MHKLQAADGNKRDPEAGLMNRYRNLPLAASLVAGVLLFAFGASRLITAPAQVIADAMHHAGPTRTAEVGR